MRALSKMGAGCAFLDDKLQWYKNNIKSSQMTNGDYLQVQYLYDIKHLIVTHVPWKIQAI